MSDENWKIFKHALVSILVGACIAFVSSLFEGVIHLLQAGGTEVVGATTGMLTYAAKVRTLWG